MSKEQAVRDAAAYLHKAIVEARADGLHVTWPSNPDGLPGIAVSETKLTVVQQPSAEPKLPKKEKKS